MNAVGHVIFNRIGAPSFAGTLHQVIYGKNQFSSMSISTDPEYKRAAPSVTDREHASYVAAKDIVNAVAAGTIRRRARGTPVRVVRIALVQSMESTPRSESRYRLRQELFLCSVLSSSKGPKSEDV
jgi:hypothetical protein